VYRFWQGLLCLTLPVLLMLLLLLFCLPLLPL